MKTIVVPFLPPAEAYPRHSIFEDSYCFRANFPFPSFGSGHSLLKGVVASRSPANPRFLLRLHDLLGVEKGPLFPPVFSSSLAVAAAVMVLPPPFLRLWHFL